MAGHLVSLLQTASDRSRRSASAAIQSLECNHRNAIPIVDWRGFGDTGTDRISRPDRQAAASTGGNVASDTNGREERLAQALRANLHRRKAQSRARRQGDGAASADTALKNTERPGPAVDKGTDKVTQATGSAGGGLDHG